MNYRQRNNGIRRGRRIAIIFTIILVAGFALSAVFPSFVDSIFLSVAKPIWGGERFVGNGFGSIISFFTSKSALSEENNNLKILVERLKGENLSLRSAAAENREMRELFDRPAEEMGVPAVVLSGPPISPYDVFIIDVGSNKGVEKGDIVMGPGGFALGDVLEVHGSFSKVQLFSYPGRKISVRIGADGILAEAYGSGTGTFEMVLPREIKLSVNDPVSLVDFRSAPYGEITSIEHNESDFLQMVRFGSPVNIFYVRFVEVLTSTSLYEEE